MLGWPLPDVLARESMLLLSDNWCFQVFGFFSSKYKLSEAKKKPTKETDYSCYFLVLRTLIGLLFSLYLSVCVFICFSIYFSFSTTKKYKPLWAGRPYKNKWHTKFGSWTIICQHLKWIKISKLSLFLLPRYNSLPINRVR